MFWVPKLVAGGMTTLACLAVGLGVGLTAAGPPAAKSGDRPKPVKAAPPDLERAREKEAEANYQRAKAMLERAQAEFNKATVDLEVMQLQLMTARLQAEAASPSIKVIVRPAADGFVYGIEERSGRYAKKAGESGSMRTDTDSPKVLDIYLSQAQTDPAAPKRVRFEVIGKQSDTDTIHQAATACVRAGFKTVTYTGPLPERWSRGVTNDGKPTTTWTGMESVKDKQVDLTKVLPLPDVSMRPTAWFEVVVSGSSKTYSVSSCPLTPGMTVREAITLHPDINRAAANGEVVLVRKATNGKPSQEIEIEWPGGDQRGGDLQLQPDDRLRIATRIAWPPKW